MIYAEVIGDPIAQSKSPIIHKYWLERLGIEGDYVRTHVRTDELAAFVDRRRAEPDWRGCNVTIPHKEAVIPLLDRLDAGAAAIGAVNCVVPQGGALVGYNTDIDGVAAALDSTELRGRKVALIGAGGAARAVVAYLARRGTGLVAVVARNPDKAEALAPLAPQVDLLIVDFSQADLALVGTAVIVNASSLGMVGAGPIPHSLLDALCRRARDATIFDMVTTPVQTDFLAAAREGGGRPVDGLTMLVGQAAGSFELFFRAPAPAPDEKLRGLLGTVSHDSP